MIEISQTVFVDGKFGNDRTGQINDLSQPFRTFDAGYLAIPDRSISFNISLAPGDYVNELELYENISVISTNGSGAVNPRVLTTQNVLFWRGLIWSDVDLLMDVDPLTFREPITIQLASMINPSVNLILNQFTTTLENGILAINFTTTLKNGVLAHDVSSDLSKGDILNHYKPLSAQQIAVRSLFVSERAFIILAIPIVNTLIQTLYTLVDDENLAIIGLPRSNEVRAIGMLIGAIVRNAASVIFQGVEKNQPASLYYLLDPSIENPILALIEAVGERVTTQVITSVLNLSINVPDILVNSLISVLTNPALIKENTVNENIQTRQVVQENQISAMIQRQVEEIFESQQQQINNMLDDPDEIPRIACLNSSITINGDQTFLTRDDLTYLIDKSNLSNVILPENNNAIINSLGTEGSDINKGSQFTLYRVINNNYTHDLLDGIVFLVNASERNLRINLIIDQEWDGRVITYRRIDTTCNKIKIINASGLFDNCKRYIRLKDHLKLLIKGNGQIFII